MHVLAIDGDHGHLQAGDADIEVGHGGTVDEAQAQLLARPEQRGPVAQRGRAIDQVGVGVGVDVGQVGWRHPHRTPHPAVGQGRLQAVLAHVLKEVTDGALVVVVMAGHLLQPRKQRLAAQIGPVRELHHVVAVVGEWLRLDRIDDQRPVQPVLLLEPGVAVVPVGAGLADVEAVQITLATADAVEAHPRHAVHVGRQQHAMPVDRGLRAMDRTGRQRVGDAKVDRAAFAPAQDRRRQRAVDGDRRPGAASEIHRGLADDQVELGPGQDVGVAGALQRPTGPGPQPQTQRRTAGGQALHETASRQPARGAEAEGIG